MSIKPIEKVAVGEQVYDQLKKLLLEGEWAPGSKIPSENELADMFHVSRVTVRQALQKLNALGLLETRLGEGSFVKTLDAGENMNALIPTVYLGEQSIMQVIEFRQIIETECARLAARRASDEDVKELERLWDNMKKWETEKNIKEFSKADLDFHFEVAKITGNGLIIKTNSILRDVLECSMDKVIEKMGYESGLYYHGEILKAIADHDEEKAAKMMKEHIGRNKDFF